MRVMTLVVEFVRALEANNRKLFHFTDSRNIPSILANGLLPTSRVRQMQINAITGGDADSLGID